VSLQLQPPVVVAGGRERSAAVGRPLRIVVIHHRRENPPDGAGHLIGDFAQRWTDDGHEVVHVCGPRSHVPADIAVLHVDLSVVPRPYLALARRYPAALNVGLADIRKRRVSEAARLPPGNGPVVVKNNLNHRGVPEVARHGRLRGLGLRVLWKATRLAAGVSTDYPVFPTVASVPAVLRLNPAFVVEPFIPERLGDGYVLRQSYFLGDRVLTWLVPNGDPFIHASRDEDDIEIPTPPAIHAARAELRLDYGKIDYLEFEGRPIILDVAKTIGGRGTSPATVERLAPGIAAYANAREALAPPPVAADLPCRDVAPLDVQKGAPERPLR